MAAPKSDPAVTERLRRIEAITDVALTQLKTDDMFVALLDRVRELLEVDTAVVLLLDEAGQQLTAAAARGIEEEVFQGVRIPLGRGFAGRVAADRRPVMIERIDQTNVLNPILTEKGIRSLLGVPLLVGGVVIGVLHVGTITERRFGDEDVRFLQLAADRVALAAHARMSEAERAAASALQRSLMPTMLPLLPGLELAARYVPNEVGGIGGDWYDVFTLPSGWLCVVMGDVVGHGLRAAVVMGRLRSALRAYALEGGGPAMVLEKLDKKVQHFEPDAMATVLCAKFDPSFEQLQLSSAGHPAPVMAMPDEASTLLDIAIDPPLGVRYGIHRRTSTVELPAGALLSFYTDGLVERRGRSLEDGLQQLCKSVWAGPAESVCMRVMSSLIGAQRADDDVALLTVRRRANVTIQPLMLVLPAVPDSLRKIRRAASRWLAAAGADQDEESDLQLVVGEACSNVVEHAYGPLGGSVTVRMELRPPDVLATVSDTGSWRPPRGHNRGRGTLLMERCSDEVRVEHAAFGTQVHIRKQLRDPAREEAG